MIRTFPEVKVRNRPLQGVSQERDVCPPPSFAKQILGVGGIFSNHKMPKNNMLLYVPVLNTGNQTLDFPNAWYFCKRLMIVKAYFVNAIFRGYGLF
jgi:hypothetical protein